MGKTKKGGTAKRPASKRRATVRTARRPQHARLAAMLSEAAGQIDEKGLLFLLQQANVLIHNQKVDEVNRELAALSAVPGRAPARASGRRTQAAVSIDDSGGRSATFLTIGAARKVLNLAELKQLVRICYAAESKTDALRQLYTVLARERSDILADAGIGSPANPLLEGLFYALRRKYRLEDR
jgi:hypothetical protein